jgi:hypothetical protein
VNIMTIEHRKELQRGIYTEMIAGSAVTFNRVQLSPVPARDDAQARRRLMTIAGIAKERSLK